MLRAPFLKSSDHPQRRARIDEQRRSHGDGTRARENEFRRVAPIAHAAERDHRHARGLGHRVIDVVHHAHHDRMNPRSRETSALTREPKRARLYINRHCAKRVGHDQPLRSARDRCVGHRNNVTDVGREFYKHRFRSHARFDLREQLRECARVFAKLKSVAGVGARHVEFHRSDFSGAVKRVRQRDVFIDGVARDRTDKRTRKSARSGQFLREKPLQSDIGQTDGIEHPCGAFDDAPRRVALARFDCD